MKTLVMRGGRNLYGTVKIGGSKNAALPLLFATLITRGVSVFDGVPDIADVRAAVSILRSFGALVSFPKPGRVAVDTSFLENTSPKAEDVKKIRASSYLIGAGLGRFSAARLLPFGGCAFCDRPIDMHLSAAAAFGAVSDGEVLTAKDGLHGASIRFHKVSVGATVNALLMAVCADGDSEIHGAAKEPHVLALVDYLNAAGADVTLKDNVFFIKKSAPLHGASVRIIPDMIEAGTYLLCGLVTGGEVTVDGVCSSDLSSFLSSLRTAGAVVKIEKDRVSASMASPTPFSVETAPFPGFPTDLQPPISVLMANAGGDITETVYPERFGYLSSLCAFGVVSASQNGRAHVYPSALHNGNTAVFDLRGGAAACLCALAAKGESVIERAEILLRGYENLSTKLSALGADVEIK